MGRVPRACSSETASEVALWSRNGRPLLRYFPELRAVGELLPPDSALDGEIVISRDGKLDFDAMQMRLHPAESRVRKLSAEIPATFVAFDLLLWDGAPVHERPIEERRAELERLATGVPLSPVSDDVEQGRAWLQTLQAAGFDGVIAKKLGLPYLPGSRDGVVKVKPHKTADCVVVGVRWKKGGRSTIATLLLGLYARRRRPRLRRLVRGRREGAGRDRGEGAAAPRREQRPPASPSRTAGAPATSSRRRSCRSSSSRCASTSSRSDASGTGRSSCASATTRIPRSARGARCARRGGPTTSPSRI